jgi:prolyl oligopeptidase
VANIRGGGEFGPAWHQAALREKRVNAFADFAAVAADLVARGITTPAQLGIEGDSNGGLLMGVMLTSYPALFGAVVATVPLLDMRRYAKLLAGASWIAEYGDPDVEADWAYLREFSPYHNVRPDRSYPPVLLMTSTRDDRVHPGHARKMVARLREQGHEVSYYENAEGGHGAAADNEQAATLWAMTLEYLWRKLTDARPAAASPSEAD